MLFAFDLGKKSLYYKKVINDFCGGKIIVKLFSKYKEIENFSLVVKSEIDKKIIFLNNEKCSYRIFLIYNYDTQSYFIDEIITQVSDISKSKDKIFQRLNYLIEQKEISYDLFFYIVKFTSINPDDGDRKIIDFNYAKAS